MERIVWITRVLTKNFIDDYISGLKNIFGGRLKQYEIMLNDGLKGIVEEFYVKYPLAKQVRIEFSEFTGGALAIMVHGVVDVK